MIINIFDHDNILDILIQMVNIHFIVQNKDAIPVPLLQNYTHYNRGISKRFYSQISSKSKYVTTPIFYVNSGIKSNFFEKKKTLIKFNFILLYL